MAQFYNHQAQRNAVDGAHFAVMTPHMIFAAITVVGKLLLPSECVWISTQTYVTIVFKLLYPFAATILLVFDFWRADWNEKDRRKQFLTDQRANSTSEGGDRTLLRTNPTAIAKAKKKRRSSLVNFARHP
jgi:hypothetical protein